MKYLVKEQLMSMELVAWHEEEPAYVDDYTQREVYYEDGLWKYTDDSKEVEDQDGFFCGTKYSWS